MAAAVCAARTGVGDDVLAGTPTLPIDSVGNGPGAHLLLAGLRLNLS
jgi:hypothetical protein